MEELVNRVHLSKRDSKIKQEKRPAQQQSRPQTNEKPQETPAQQPVTTSTASGKTLRHVDTRVSNVNLDKYNEHYEEIAPNTPVTKNTQRKQKINQRSAQRGDRTHCAGRG